MWCPGDDHVCGTKSVNGKNLFGKILKGPDVLHPMPRVETDHRNRRRTDVDIDSVMISVAGGTAA